MNPAARKNLAALVSVASNTALIVMKVSVGMLIGSVSVISEAIHSSMDLLAAVIALLAVREGSKPADEKHPFGHGKFENLSGTVEAVLIFTAAGWIAYEAIVKFQGIVGDIQAGRHPQEGLPLFWGVGIMAVSALVNRGVSRMLFKVGKETDSVALQADAWHLRTDVWTSVGVMVALGVILIGDWVIPSMGVWLHLVDPIAAILVAVLIIRAAWTLTIQSARDLVDVTLPAEEEQWIKDTLRRYPSVHGFHRMRTRKSGPLRFVEFHIFVDANMTVRQSHSLSHQIAQVIREHFGDASVTVHVEPCLGNCDRPEGHGS
jgi:cation diffusion facilitator family transporter